MFHGVGRPDDFFCLEPDLLRKVDAAVSEVEAKVREGGCNLKRHPVNIEGLGVVGHLCWVHVSGCLVVSA